MQSNSGAVSNIKEFTALRLQRQLLVDEFHGVFLNTNLWSPVIEGDRSYLEKTWNAIKLIAGGAINDNANLYMPQAPLQSLNLFPNQRWRAYVRCIDNANVLYEVGLYVNVNDFIHFHYTDANPNWIVTVRGSGVSTIENTGVPLVLGWQYLEMHLTPAAIQFYIDDVLVKTITTNINPANTYALRNYVETLQAGGADKQMQIDRIAVMVNA